MAAQLGTRRRLLDEGAGSLGWKLAFGSAQVLEQLGLGGPAVGFLTTRTRLESGVGVSISGWTKPALEPEVAVHMSQDLGPGASREEAMAAIAGLGPAIELADADRPPAELEAVVAGDIFHRAVIIGSPDPGRAGGSLDGLRARVTIDGSEIAQTDDLTALTGDLVDNVGYVADLLATFGEALRAGEVIITGAVVPLIWLSPGQRIEYELEPVGRLEVSIAR